MRREFAIQIVVLLIARFLGVLGAVAGDVECQIIFEHQLSGGIALVTEELALGGRQDPVTPTCKY